MIGVCRPHSWQKDSQDGIDLGVDLVDRVGGAGPADFAQAGIDRLRTIMSRTPR